MKRSLLGPQNSTGKKRTKKTMQLQIWTTFHGKDNSEAETKSLGGNMSHQSSIPAQKN